MSKSANSVTAYLDCFSGISGDMFLGALLDAGLPLKTLTETLKEIDLPGYRIDCQKTGEHSTIQGTQVRVLPDPPAGEGEAPRHPYRDWRTIRTLLTDSRLSQAIKARALAIFQVLAEAEAKVHGCPVEEVHFHEVGAVDSIVDIVGAAIGLDHFGIDTLWCAPLPLANGTVPSAHGILPLPAPAVCEILKGVEVYGVPLAMELVTPTGAAIVKACAAGVGPLPPMAIARVGYGAGSQARPDGRPNLLRLIIGEGQRVTEAQEVTVIETNLDDWSPETFPFLSERLFSHGALDVTLTPVQMKKGRPGFTIQVIAPPAHAFPLQQLILTETSAIGLRCRKEERRTLARSLGTVPTPLGAVKVKLIEGPQGKRLTPEYEDCRRLALETGRPITEIYRLVASHSPDQFQSLEKDKG